MANTLVRKIKGRLRRAKKVRSRQAGKVCLSVHRTGRHIYAQVFSADRSKVLVSASTIESSIRETGYTGNCDAAKKVGKLIAERCISAGIKKVSFDRKGFRYHGRVAALAASARESGLEC